VRCPSRAERGLKWIVPPHFHNESVEPVDQSRVGKKHERAIAFDYVRTLRAAELHGVPMVVAIVYTSIDPNFHDASLSAFAHCLVSCIRRAGHQQRGFHRRGDIGYAGKTLSPLDLRGLRIYRNRVVSFLLGIRVTPRGEKCRGWREAPTKATLLHSRNLVISSSDASRIGHLAGESRPNRQ